ncbi:uncharacterized protein LOC100678078 [Nasonia vitripennis]|uniref:Uncharacterized protein n=1 Tax=Nasonia vitripennis TaxID=7425 RepID=A0A7M7GFX0_NASVI|nr:uncharacterized protein LOC100678078 [Nasonia vitripennis]XP_008213697.1 uncharacterized protein LOC100678078 [Nasonia vitripennis]XP_008213698.1 uncharacterized protein LOC100678078 [Nasonia vitripennis]
MRAIIVLVVALLAVALAAPAEDSSVNQVSETGTHKYDGNINFDLFGESSIKHTLEGLIAAVKDTLKLFGLENSIQSEHQGSGKLQGNFNFAGEGSKTKVDGDDQK